LKVYCRLVGAVAWLRIRHDIFIILAKLQIDGRKLCYVDYALQLLYVNTGYAD